MNDPKTLRSVARRLLKSANMRENMFPDPGPAIVARLSEARDWAGMLNREARRIERARQPSKGSP